MKQYLSAAEEKQLVMKAKAGDSTALNTLLESQYGQVMKHVHRFSETSVVSKADLFQEGMVALLTAFQSYDPDHGNGFYAFYRKSLQGTLSDYAERNGYSVRVDFRFIAKVKELFKEYDPEEKKPVHCAIAKRIADELGDLTVGQVQSILEASQAVPGYSLDDTGDDMDSPFELADDASLNPEEAYMAEEYQSVGQKILDECLGKLTPREADILRQRKLCAGVKKTTLADLSATYGVSINRTKEIQDKAWSKFIPMLREQWTQVFDVAL